MGRDLLEAIVRKKASPEVKRMINASSVKEKDPYYSKIPLFWALSYGAETDVIEALLRAWPDSVKEKDTICGWTALHFAEKVDAAAVEMMLKGNPAAASTKDELGMLPLHWACEYNCDVKVVKALLDAYPEGVKERDLLLRLPLKFALDGNASKDVLDLLDKAYPDGRKWLCGEAGSGQMLAGSTEAEGPPPVPCAVMFPGQGSQYVKMLAGVKDMPAVKKMLDDAKGILGYDLLQLCLEGPESKLEETRYCQPAMFIGGLAGLEKLRDTNPDAASRPQAMAGLSLGEYTALVASGVLTFEDGLKLVKLRGEAMQEAAEASAQGMLSVAGIPKAKLEGLCADAAKQTGEVCQIANELFPKGFSCAGNKKAVDTLKDLAEKNGALQARLLKTSGGFHTPLMQGARKKLEKAIAEVAPKMKPPKCDLYLNVTAEKLPKGASPKDLPDKMARQLTSSVLWEPSVKAMIDDGLNEFYECGPMKQLKAMMKRIDGKMWGNMQNIEV